MPSFKLKVAATIGIFLLLHFWLSHHKIEDSINRTENYLDIQPEEESLDKYYARLNISTSIPNLSNSYQNSTSSLNWIIISFTSYAYIPISEIWYTQLTELGYHNHRIYALDQKAFDYFSSHRVYDQPFRVFLPAHNHSDLLMLFINEIESGIDCKHDEWVISPNGSSNPKMKLDLFLRFRHCFREKTKQLLHHYKKSYL